MPDLDYIHKKVRSTWRQTISSFKEGESILLTGRTVISSLVRTIKQAGGFPGALEAQKALHLKGQAGDLLFERTFGGTHAKIVVRTALRLAEQGAGSVSVDEVNYQCICETLNYGFASHPEMIWSTGLSPSQAAEKKTELLRFIEPELRRLGRSLTSDPTAADLRKPRMPTLPKQSMASMLEEVAN